MISEDHVTLETAVMMLKIHTNTLQFNRYSHLIYIIIIFHMFTVFLLKSTRSMCVCRAGFHGNSLMTCTIASEEIVPERRAFPGRAFTGGGSRGGQRSRQSVTVKNDGL